MESVKYIDCSVVTWFDHWFNGSVCWIDYWSVIDCCKVRFRYCICDFHPCSFVLCPRYYIWQSAAVKFQPIGNFQRQSCVWSNVTSPIPINIITYVLNYQAHCDIFSIDLSPVVNLFYLWSRSNFCSIEE